MTLNEAKKLAEKPPSGTTWSDFPMGTRGKVLTALALLNLHIQHLEDKDNK